MLTVKTYLDQSTVHGIGLFADQFISKDKEIWVFNPHVDLVYSEEQWNLLRSSISVESFASLRRLSFKEKGSFILCIDNSQFMNHSSERANVYQVDHENIMRASKDIQRGEELLCNYFEYSDHDDFHNLVLKRREKMEEFSEKVRDS